MELEDPADYVCSVKWIKEGNVLAVGNLHGEISLWDVEQMKKMRTMTGHADRVGALDWNEVNILAKRMELWSSEFVPPF